MSKPSVFIGSSVESLPISNAIHKLLEYDALVTVWPQGIFLPSGNTLDSLLKALDTFDFGIFVFSPDDVVTIKKEQMQAVRDNVLFELGLFIGRLGRERSFIVLPRNQKDFHLPTDLLGMTPATFDPNRPDNNLKAALGPACDDIKTAIKQVQQAEQEQGVGWAADIKCYITSDPHDPPVMNLEKGKLEKLRLVIDNQTGKELDKLHICFGSPLELLFIPWGYETKPNNDPDAPSHHYYWLTREQLERLNRRSQAFQFMLNGSLKGVHDILIIGVAAQDKFVHRVKVHVK